MIDRSALLGIALLSWAHGVGAQAVVGLDRCTATVRTSSESGIVGSDLFNPTDRDVVGHYVQYALGGVRTRFGQGSGMWEDHWGRPGPSLQLVTGSPGRRRRPEASSCFAGDWYPQQRKGCTDSSSGRCVSDRHTTWSLTSCFTESRPGSGRERTLPFTARWASPPFAGDVVPRRRTGAQPATAESATTSQPARR